MKDTKKFQNDLFEFLYDNGLMLVHVDTGKQIEVGRGDKDFMVTEGNELTGKEYSSIRGALREVSR